jgi:hypothetical protein
MAYDGGHHRERVTERPINSLSRARRDGLIRDSAPSVHVRRTYITSVHVRVVVSARVPVLVSLHLHARFPAVASNK